MKKENPAAEIPRFNCFSLDYFSAHTDNPSSLYIISWEETESQVKSYATSRTCCHMAFSLLEAEAPSDSLTTKKALFVNIISTGLFQTIVPNRGTITSWGVAALHLSPCIGYVTGTRSFYPLHFLLYCSTALIASTHRFLFQRKLLFWDYVPRSLPATSAILSLKIVGSVISKSAVAL